MTKIVCFKLISGDEVVGELKENNGDSFVMRKPFIVLASQQGVGLLPVMLTGKEEHDITFLKGGMATLPIPVLGDFEKHYMQKTTTLQLLT